MFNIKGKILKTKYDNEYRVEEKIGNGAYGVVFKVTKIKNSTDENFDPNEL